MKRELKKVLYYIEKLQMITIKQMEDKCKEYPLIPHPILRESVIEYNKAIDQIFKGLYYLGLIDKVIYYKVGKNNKGEMVNE